MVMMMLMVMMTMLRPTTGGAVLILIMIMVVFAFAATHFETVHICGRRYQYYTRLQSQTGVNLDVLVSTNINVIKIVSGHLFVSSAKS